MLDILLVVSCRGFNILPIVKLLTLKSFPLILEEVFQRKEIFPLGIQISPKVKEERFGIIGNTKKGRILQVVFTMRKNQVRPISAWPADRKERLQYEKGIRSQT